MALVSMGLCLGSLIADEWLSVQLRGMDLPGDIRKAVNLSEAFAHGFGVAALLSILLVASTDRRRLWGVALLAAGSGLVANGLKATIVRVRPHSVGAVQVGSVARELAATTSVEVVEASFWDARQRSFPSGHAATACGLAIGLSLVYPAGTPLFVLLALLACMQRITSGAHFPSDVFAGIGVSSLCTLVALSITRVRHLFQANRS